MHEYKSNDIFTPLELTEENVDTLFNYCLWNSALPYSKEQCCISLPFPLNLGYSREISNYVKFDRRKLLEKKQIILYLLGQIHNIEGRCSIGIGDLIMRYDSVCWYHSLNNIIYPLNFAYLITAEPLNILSDFEENHHARILSNIEATLSPNDLDFPEWYQDYKRKHPELNVPVVNI